MAACPACNHDIATPFDITTGTSTNLWIVESRVECSGVCSELNCGKRLLLPQARYPNDVFTWGPQPRTARKKLLR